LPLADVALVIGCASLSVAQHIGHLGEHLGCKAMLNSALNSIQFEMARLPGGAAAGAVVVSACL
jgi:hypothetical protein